MSVGAWRAEIVAAESIQALNAVYEKYDKIVDSGLHEEFMGMLAARKGELIAAREAAKQPQYDELQTRSQRPGVNPAIHLSTAAPIVQSLLDQHANAIGEYERVSKESATAEAEYKREYARAYLQNRADGAKTVAEAEYKADADETVSDARLKRNIGEGLERAARMRVENIERKIDYYRSVMVSERELDKNERSR